MSLQENRMNIPTDVLEDLKCGNCERYLSWSPVYLQHDGAGVCGQCYAPNHPATLNKQYQAVAKLLKFPCKNWELGCRETVPFAEEAEEIAHEAACEFRRYVCPVLGSARCDWVGPRAAMLSHCREQHPDRVLDNPCRLTHDIAWASLRNYILPAFQLLSFLHTKVCVAAGKVFHAVRLLGCSKQASDHSCTLNIKRGVEQLSKVGQVTSEGCLAIQGDSSVAVENITRKNSRARTPGAGSTRQNVLGGFDDTTFTVTLKRRVSVVAEQLARSVEKCRSCEAVLTCPRGWCERCAPDMRACENRTQSCTYTDYSVKCWKHEVYFCKQSTWCCICRADVSRGILAAHYGSAHQDVTYRAGSTWRTKQNTQYCLLTSGAGTAVCWYLLSDSQFILEVYTLVPGEQLHKFRCSVQVTNPATGNTRIFTPDLLYDQMYDWRTELKKDDFPSWNVVFDICVDISEIE